MNADMIFSFIRHALTIAGTYFATSGAVETATVETGVGAVMTLIGLGWGIWSKKAPKAA